MAIRSKCAFKLQITAVLQGFYSVHGEDALFVARQFYKTTAVVKYLGKQDSGLPGISMT